MMAKKNKKIKILDLIILGLFIPLAIFLAISLKVNYFSSIFLFFGIPSIWLSFRNHRKIKKALLFSFVIVTPFLIIIDYIAIINKSWYLPSSVFSFRLFNIIPVEDFIWGFILVYLTVMFYEYFLDKGRDELYYKQLKYFLWIISSALLLFFVLFFLKPEILVIKYAYLSLGIVLILIPSIVFLIFFPSVLYKFFKASIYFFFLSLFYELVALDLGLWIYPSNYFIGWVKILKYRFPFEELFFWIICITIGILSYYEFFNDDRK
ncbi:lycopene cyclase domain-containing protein [bacterium]|nr:lycopene cyclase domain-containing protein [bacterium]